jgi:hypothetical protein
MAQYAKNFLPIFFNLFATCPEEEEGHLLKAIEAYLSVTDETVREKDREL